MQRHVERLMRRVQHVVGVGRISAPVNDTGAVQTVQVQTMGGVHVDNVPVHGLFGVISVMPAGSDVSFVSVSGDSSAMVAVSTGHQGSRVRGQVAGVAGLHDEVGTMLLLSNDNNATLTLTGIFTIKAGPATFVFSSSGLAITGGMITVDGAIVAGGNVTAGAGTADQVTLQLHKHPTAAPGSPSVPTPGS